MKMSEVTIAELKLYCRADDIGDEEDSIFQGILEAGKQFVMSQTGMTAEECDEKADLTIAMLMFCSDLYDNRTYSVAATKTPKENPAVKAILDQYNMNMLA